jgi:DNA-binding IclR family transcriptional regulator
MSNEFIAGTAPVSPNVKRIQSVDRACTLLQHLRDTPNDMALHELATAIDVHPSTAYRLLGSLQHAGFVVRDALTGRYRLGLEPVTLSGAALGRLDVVRVADPELRRLAENSNETVNFGIRYGDQLLNIEQMASADRFRSFGWMGQRVPLHVASAARSMLAFLPDEEVEGYLKRAVQRDPRLDVESLRSQLAGIRVRGYALNRGEIDPDVYGIGAPVLGRDGTACATVTVVGYRARFTPERIEHLVPMLLRTTGTISRQMGYDGYGFTRVS